MVIYAVYIFAAASIILIVGSLFGFRDLGARQIKLPVNEGKAKKGRALNFYLGKIFPFSGALLRKLNISSKLSDKLEVAHLHWQAAEFFNFKLVGLILCGLAGYLMLKDQSLVGGLIGAVLGYAVPSIWLKARIAKRKNAIVRVLPETVDLLGLCVEAGLDFTMAIKWLLDKKITSNPMLEELTTVLEEIKWGKPRSNALKDMSRRLNITEVGSFIQTLVQAERMGTPVTEAFAILSEDTRMQRFHRGERIAMQAPIKILIPLIFCILPVIAIIIGGPILLQFMQGNLPGAK